MTEATGETRALRPLWSLVLGTIAGSLSSIHGDAAPAWLVPGLVVIGVGLLGSALWFGRRASRAAAFAWFAAGLTLAGGTGIRAASARRVLAGLVDQEPAVWIRAELAVLDGWSPSRWGWQNRVEVRSAEHPHRAVRGLDRPRIEVRGAVEPLELPPPGSVVRALVSIRGSPERPLLVVSSPRLLEPVTGRNRIATIRETLANGLFSAAGTDLARVRAAELAGALALGRRDLLPSERRDGWRRSGLAHVLAVSGLHVGLVGGALWLLLAFAGAPQAVTRWALLIVLPSYAVLAGGPPSAVRAALMASVYLTARLMGRAIVPMAAVLLTAAVLLVADPALVTRVSFQLTVLITAALVRWTPPAVHAVPLPAWLGGAVVVPVIAQLAAAPIVAQHFRSAIPGAAVANLLVPIVLAPVVLAAVAATALAPLLPTAAAWLLDLVDLGSRALWTVSAPGRAVELVPPAAPTWLIALFVVFGLAALLPGRAARGGLIAYTLSLVLTSGWWWSSSPAERTTVELLPVSNGLALLAGTRGERLLMDGGGSRREAAELLADARVRRLAAVVVSHGDEDHIGGLATVLRSTATEALILPAWLRTRPEAVPLIREARHRGVRIVPVARGSRVLVAEMDLTVVWPPADRIASSDNESSVVARLGLAGSTVLLTADIGRTTERMLSDTTDLRCDILIVPHHGSRGSASPKLLEGSGATVALIPAGPDNLHHHPHEEVLARLDDRDIEYRMPLRDGRCGARLEDGEWVLFP